MRHWALLLFGLTVTAQERVGSIQGTVADTSGASVARASVEVRGAALPSFMRLETDDAGAYLFASLPPGEYTVTINAKGFRPYEWKVSVGVGDRPRLDAVLTLAPLPQSVVVTADAPALDTGRTLTAESATARMFRDLPNAHTADSLAWLSPGVLGDAKAGGLQVEGASGAENVFVIDGVEASSIFDGTLTAASHIPTEWISETQVKRGGLDSQFGGAIGGVINAVTRSGGNQWHGQGSLYLRVDVLNAGPRPWLVLSPFNSNVAGYFTPAKDGFRELTPGYQIGGPLRKNRLWIFSSAYPVFRHFDRTVTFLSNGQTGTFQGRQQQMYSMNRLDYQPVNRLRANLAFYYNPIEGDGALPNPLGIDSPSTPWAQEGYRGPAAGLTWQVDYTIGSRTLISAFGGVLGGNYREHGIPTGTYYYFADGNAQVAAPDGSPLPIPANLTGAAGSFTPNSLQTLLARDRRYNLNASASHWWQRHGQHEWRGGYTLNLLSNDELRNTYPGGYVRLCWNCTYSSPSVPNPTRGLYGVYRNRINESSGELAGSNHGIFLQDSWRVWPNLQLNLGIRAERESVPAYHPSGTPAPPSPIVFPFRSKIAPRLGAAWDPTRSGRMRVYGSFGLYYDVMKYSLARGLFGGVKFRDYIYTLDDANFLAIRPNPAPDSAHGIFPGRLIDVQDYAPTANDPNHPRIDPALSPMRQHSYEAGFQYSFPGAWIAGMRYSRKRLDRAIEDMDIPAGGVQRFFVVNPGESMAVDPAQFPAGYPVPPFPSAARNYDGLEFTVQAPSARRLYFQASYVYGRLWGNYTGLANSDEGGRLSPNTTRAFDEPWMYFDARGQRVAGPLPTDRAHTFKCAGAYSLRSKGGTTTLGLTFFALSGAPLTTEAELVYSGAVSYVNGRGDLGRTPALTDMDALLAHEFRLGNETRKLRLEWNVSNVFNQAAVTDVYTRYNHINDGPLAFLDITATMRGFDYRAMMFAQKIRADPRYGQADAFQSPRDVRIGLHFIF
jgi:hypothetical protein